MCQACMAVSTIGSNINTDLWHVGAGEAQPDYNGNGATAGQKGLSGNATVDGLLYGTNGSNNYWTTSITYSFPDSPSDYGTYTSDADGNGTSAQFQGFSQFSASQQAVVNFALNADAGPSNQSAFSVEGFTNLTITAASADTGNSTLRFANSSDAGTAYAYRPGNYVQAGDSFYGTNSSIRNPNEGTYGWMTTLHEIGHALGLKHGHEADNFAGNATVLPSATDSHEYSLMTYRSYAGAATDFLRNGTFDFPQTFMMHDIAALQYLYGADYSVAANNGNTVYKWNPNSGDTLINGEIAIDMADGASSNRIFATIWDGGGTDTYDLSSYTTNLTINLMPGASSLFSTTQRANLGDGNFAAGNIYNALQYQGDARSLIEWAIAGSGNDFLIGNDAANVLLGGLGADVLFHSGGGDLFNGGGGTDYVSYASGAVDMGQNMRIDLVNSFLNAGLAFGDTFVEVEAFFLSQGNDLFSGDTFNNFVFGQNGDDVIAGAGGGDIIYGEGGNDFIISGALGDLVSGGAGADTFFYSINQIEQDSILDFTSGVDKIAFDAVGFNMKFQAVILGFNFLTTTSGVGYAAAAAGQAQFIYYTDLGLLYADVDGGGGASANLIAQLAGTPTLLASDFAIL